MKSYTQTQSPDPSPSSALTPLTGDAILITLLLFTLSLAALLGTAAHIKNHRVEVRKQRIQLLERAWKLSPKEKWF